MIEHNAPTLDHRGHPVEQWEYDVITSEEPLDKDQLNAMGRDGWILSSYSGVIDAADGSRVYYFRRRVQCSPRLSGHEHE